MPCLRYRDYSDDQYRDPQNYVHGIRIYADDGNVITNYPEQHIENGKKKNIATSYRFKKMVRIAKKIRSIMEENGCQSAKHISSFGLESLIWNIDDDTFAKYGILRYCFGEVVDRMVYYKDILDYHTFKEANDIKKLCSNPQEALRYKAFIEDLSKFYEYDV